MIYLAHTENEGGVAYPLKDHLRGVGELETEFAEQMNPSMCEAASWAGLPHYLGKYRDEFRHNRCGTDQSETKSLVECQVSFLC